MAGGRVDEVPDNVFRVSVADQLHLGRQPHRHGPLPALPGGHRGRRADRAGRACSASGCSTTCGAVARHRQRARPRPVRRVRPAHARRSATAVLRRLHATRVLILPGGERSIRLRPALTIGEDELEPGRRATIAQGGTSRARESFIGGKWRDDAPGGRLTSVEPGAPASRSARPCWATRPSSSRPAAVARDAQRGWAATPAPGARAGDRAHRPAGRGQRRGAGPAGHRGDRQAAGRGPRRGAGGDRHLHVLRRRGAAALRADRAQRDARTSSCSPSGCRSGWPRSSPPATSRSRCRPGTWCPRCSAATPWCGSRPSTPRPSPRAFTELFVARRAARRAC